MNFIVPGAREQLPLRERVGTDAVTYLTVYLVLFCAVPSYLTIPALGSVGRLSVLWGLVGIAWWAYYRLQLTVPIQRGSASVKIAALAFFGMLALSYSIANLRGMPSGDATTADSSFIRIASWAGVALVAIDGIPSRDRLLVLFRRIVVAGALMSLLGLIQFATGLSLVDSISLPGFETSPDFDSVLNRAGFTRAAGTAAHPLEYGSVLCMTLPLALALGISDNKRSWYVRWAPVLLIVLASMLSMSRSALIGVFVGLIFLAPSLPAKVKLTSIICGTAMLVGVVFLVPGMLGTVRGMFLGIGTDTSTLSRADSATSALQIALRNPFFGRGFGTFLPPELILDNQILLMLLEAGFVGLAAFLLLAMVAFLAGWRVMKLTDNETERALGPALSASIAAGMSTLIFFDGLSFPITAGLLFLLLGTCGSMLRVVRHAP